MKNNNITVRTVVFAAAFLALDVVFLIGQSYNPFIYFRF